MIRRLWRHFIYTTMILSQDKVSLHKEQPIVHIRSMCLDDLEQVQAIDRASFSLPWPESAFRYELLENPRSLLWVAEVNGQGDLSIVVGVIVVWMVLDEAHIATLAVRPDYRRRGIGERLLATALVGAALGGAQMATLEVRANNSAAQALYERFRFEVVGRRVHYYRDNNEDAILMTLMRLDDAYLRWLELAEWQKGAIGV
jgi:ribosomal-protein-alanine N-acetyltransferase